jgi:hypothetical protein
VKLVLLVGFIIKKKVFSCYYLWIRFAIGEKIAALSEVYQTGCFPLLEDGSAVVL